MKGLRSERSSTPGAGSFVPLCSTARSISAVSGYMMATRRPVFWLMPAANLMASRVLAPARSCALVFGSSMSSALSGGNSTSVSMLPSSIAATAEFVASVSSCAMVCGGSASPVPFWTTAPMPSSPMTAPDVSPRSTVSERAGASGRRGAGASARLVASRSRSAAECLWRAIAARESRGTRELRGIAACSLLDCCFLRRLWLDLRALFAKDLVLIY
mmetsp:Transcript_25023/g.75126  ORF Transcript_25023/g.75126 Transcript_25023/m.75126 type:complete len:216 (-) Transcript_25023:56-703(-)